MRRRAGFIAAFVRHRLPGALDSRCRLRSRTVARRAPLVPRARLRGSGQRCAAAMAGSTVPSSATSQPEPRPRDLLRRAAVPRHCGRPAGGGEPRASLPRVLHFSALTPRTGSTIAIGVAPTTTSACAEHGGIGDNWRRTSSMRAAAWLCGRRPGCSSGTRARLSEDRRTTVQSPPVIPDPSPMPLCVANRRRRALLLLAGCHSNPACNPEAEYTQAVDRPHLQLPSTLAQSEHGAARDPAAADGGPCARPGSHCLGEPPSITQGLRGSGGRRGRLDARHGSAEGVVRVWAAAWSEQNAPAVLKLWSPSFQPPGVTGTAEFLDQRREEVTTGPARRPRSTTSG